MKFLKDVEIVSSKLLHNGQEIIDINGKIDWSKIKNTPTLVDPFHNHDALYYRKEESDRRYAHMATTGSVVIPENQSGWYTIARNGNPPSTRGGDRSTGYFVIRDVYSVDHQSVHFIASTHFGNASDSQITILNNSSYHETGPFTKIRLITGGTYQGAILQVYVSDYYRNGQEVQAWLSHNLQESGWQLVNWVREDTVPSGMTAREITISDVDFAVGRSDTDKFEVKRGGHITTTGNLSAVNIDAKLIRVNNNVVWHNGNMGHGSGLNADMLDGVHADAFLRADTGGQISGTISAQSVASNDSGALHLPIVGGGGIAMTSATVTGAIKITLPQSWTNTMMQFVVDVFNFASNKSFSVLIAGYNYIAGSKWHNTSATIIAGEANRNFTVRFGHDGSKCCVYIGELNTVWEYPQIRVRDFIAGYYNYNASKWMTGWAVGFESTAFGTITSTVTNTLAVSSYALDADKLDGLNSTQFLRSDISGTLNGNLTLNGSLIRGNTTFHLNTASWDKNNGEANIAGEIVAGVAAGDARFMFHSNTGIMNVYVDGEIYLNEGQYKAWHAGNDGTGSGLDADLLDGIDSTGFLRRNADTDTTGKITITRDGDAIVFNKNSGASFSGLLFTSRLNADSDYAYIRYYDDVSNFYAPYDNGSTNENSALVIGVENDGVGYENNCGDYLVLRGSTKIILDAFASSGAPERVAEFRRQGTIVSYIDNTGKYNGDVSSNQVEVKSTSTSNKFTIEFNETENSLDFIYA